MKQGPDQSGGFRGRVLYIARAPFISGAERALLSTLRHLDRERVEPAVLLGNDGPLVDLVRALDMPVHVIPLTQRTRTTLPGWWRSVGRVRRLLRAFAPHVLHANDVPSSQAMSVVAARGGAARVVHVRWGITAADAAWFLRRGAEGVICISLWVRAELGDLAGTPLAGATVAVVPDSVDWPAEAGPPPLRQPPPEPTLGFAGQLIHKKGLDLVIEGMGRMAAARCPRLLVAGADTQSGGRYGALLRELAQRVGVAERITWLGFLDDVADLYMRSSVVVCPSRLEPLGLVPLEAARFHVPAIVNRVGGLAETVEHGRNGWLVDPTPAAWAAALEVVHDAALVARVGAAAHEHARRHHAPSVYGRRLLELYGRIAGGGAGRAK